MKQNWKRALALFTTLCMLMALLPAALAAPGDITYVLDEDGIDSGAVYAILYDGTSADSLLYHTGTGTATDQISGTVSSDGTLSIATSGSWTDSNVLWKIESTDSGSYTLKNLATGYYLDLSQATDGTASGKVKVSADVSEANYLTITCAEGYYTITGTYALMHNDVGSSASNKWFYSGEGEATQFRLFKMTEESEPEPEPADPLAIPG